MPDTPILSLRQYAGGDDMDFNEVNADYQTLDTLPPTVCTSATRPNTGLYQGRYIWESDTKRLYMYDLSTTTWRLMSDIQEDTGWLACTARATFALQAGAEACKARRIGKDIYIKGGFTNAGMAINSTHTIGDLPAAVSGISFAPLENDIRALGSSGGNITAVGFVQTGGEFSIRTGPTLGSYYFYNRSYRID